MLKNKNWGNILFVLAILIPLLIALSSVVSANFPFWYDNARDLLLARGNLHKLTLIGPTSGIPGIFYGPYWIWSLSVGLLVSKDPRIVTFLISILPYFVIFPLILSRFSKMFGYIVAISLWVLFAFNFGIIYGSRLWNPYPAPLLFLLFIYLMTTAKQDISKRECLRQLACGFVLGLILNFHISLGLGLTFGAMIFFLLSFVISLKKKSFKNYISQLASFSAGFVISLAPFLLFEVRHGFNQIRTLLETFSKYGGVVGLTGLSKQGIIESFASLPGSLFHLRPPFAYLIFIALALLLLYSFLKKTKLAMEEKRLLTILTTSSIGILFIYLTAKNPVWEYHFIGVEIIFLLLIGFLARKNQILQKILGVASIIIVIFHVFSFAHGLNYQKTEASNLSSEEKVTRAIIADSSGKDYTVFAYSPSIYSYEYSYLFSWLSGKDFSYDPGQIRSGKSLVYLIIPPTDEASKQNFINFRTPNTSYSTVKSWEIGGSTILRRELKAN